MRTKANAPGPARRVMRHLALVVSVAFVTVSAGPVGSAAADAADVRVYTGTLAGAQYRVEVPARWNGTLLLWSHGLYPPPYVPPEVGLTSSPTTERWMLDHGYALAASNYRKPAGWSVKEALGDQITLLDWFADTVGKPHRTISAGSSMGGLIAVLLAERNAGRFDGVAPLCGALAGSLGFFNTTLDVNFAVKTLLAPDSDLKLTHITDPAGTVARAKKIIAAALKTKRGRARLALAASLRPIPGWSRALEPRPTDVAGQVRAQAADWMSFFLLDITLGSVRADLERRAGGNPSWNAGVDYRRQLAHSRERTLVRRAYREAGLRLRADLHRLAAAPRIKPDAGAAAYLARYGRTRGRTPWPVVTLHTIGDGGAAPENEHEYARRVRRSGDPGQLRRFFIDRAGHCLYTPAEEITTYRALLTRIGTGHWHRTGPRALNADARAFGPAYHRLHDYIADQTGTAAPAFVRYHPGPYLRPSASPR